MKKGFPSLAPSTGSRIFLVKKHAQVTNRPSFCRNYARKKITHEFSSTTTSFLPYTARFHVHFLTTLKKMKNVINHPRAHATGTRTIPHPHQRLSSNKECPAPTAISTHKCSPIQHPRTEPMNREAEESDIDLLDLNCGTRQYPTNSITAPLQASSVPCPPKVTHASSSSPWVGPSVCSACSLLLRRPTAKEMGKDCNYYELGQPISLRFFSTR